MNPARLPINRLVDHKEGVTSISAKINDEAKQESHIEGKVQEHKCTRQHSRRGKRENDGCFSLEASKHEIICRTPSFTPCDNEMEDIASLPPFKKRKQSYMFPTVPSVSPLRSPRPSNFNDRGSGIFLPELDDASILVNGRGVHPVSLSLALRSANHDGSLQDVLHYHPALIENWE